MVGIIFWQNLIFWAEAFFQRSLETFLWILRTCSSYLKGLLNLDFCVSKISWPHNTPIKFYVRKSEKCWDFEKMKLKIGLEYSDKTSCFELKLFQRPLTNFLTTLRTCSRCLQGPRNLVFCVSKKLWPHDTPRKNINKKKRDKKKIFGKFPWHDYTFSTFLENRSLKVRDQLRYAFR